MSAARSRELCIMACAFCRDPLFHAWMGALLGDENDGSINNEEGSKAFILSLCQIETRNHLDIDQAAAARFHELVRKPFVEWKAAQESREVRHGN